MPLEDLITLAGTIAGITLVLVSFLKDLVVDPFVKGEPQRSALLRAANYVLNFGLLALALVANNVWDGRNFITYVALAFGQSLGTDFVYKRATRGAGVNPAATPTPVDMTGKVVTLPPPLDTTGN